MKTTNPELLRILKKRTGDLQLIQTLMYEMWRGRSLTAVLSPAGGFLKIRLAEGVCLPAFTHREAAEAFLNQLALRGAPPMALKEVSIEELLTETGGALLGLNVSSEHSALLPDPALQSIRRATAELTGGRTSAEDLRLMRLHMNTVGNAARVRAATRCGCFHCKTIFAPTEIDRFIPERDGKETAMCPRCGVDAVLTNLDGEPLTDTLIEEMHTRFFTGGESVEDAGLRMMYIECMRERLQNP